MENQAQISALEAALEASGDAAGAYGLACLFAMGVDFPRSDRRFARLAPVDTRDVTRGQGSPS